MYFHLQFGQFYKNAGIPFKLARMWSHILKYKNEWRLHMNIDITTWVGLEIWGYYIVLIYFILIRVEFYFRHVSIWSTVTKLQTYTVPTSKSSTRPFKSYFYVDKICETYLSRRDTRRFSTCCIAPSTVWCPLKITPLCASISIIFVATWYGVQRIVFQNDVLE